MPMELDHKPGTQHYGCARLVILQLSASIVLEWQDMFKMCARHVPELKRIHLLLHCTLNRSVVLLLLQIIDATR